MLPNQIPSTPENVVGLQKLDQTNQALKRVLGTKEGRLVFAEFFRTFHMYTSPHESHGSTTSFNCGQQSVCFWFRQWMKTAGIYDIYHIIEKEDMERTEEWRVTLQKLVESQKKGSA